ncbi:MAG: hypothetical protein HY553_01840 [Elusimicrobia bacterium]|nr:hypothetical protein [Elusimicrobiota bacterium]
MDVLPEQYVAWLREALGAELAPESKATCSDCAMCRPWPPHGESFKPDTKCCTFVPSLPNFRVGAILSDADPAAARGRETVLARIRARDGATPLVLAPPRSFGVLYARLGAEVFGKDRGYLCPHYDAGRCSIWKWRESVCATYYCRFDRGETGRSLWNGVRRLLNTLENAVARQCALGAGIDGPALDALIVFDEAGRDGSMTRVTTPERVDRSWGEFRGREEEFYARCWELARGIGFKEALRLAGSEGDLLARAVWQRFHEALSEPVPGRLKLRGYRYSGARDGVVCIAGYADRDPVELDRDALAALSRFDGRPVDVVLDEIIRRDGVRFTPSLLRALVDHRILEAAP